MKAPMNVDIPFVRIEPFRNWVSLDLIEVWEARELLYFLIWREVKVRYKQTVFGVAWAIFQPLLTMMIFTVVFGQFVKISSDGMAYPIFFYTALLPWTYFASAMGRTTNSLVSDAHLIQKVYFPRLILPLASVVSPLLDFLSGFVVLLGLMFWYKIPLTWGVLLLPFLVVLILLTALTVSLWLAPLNVRYRDVAHVTPFLIQTWMYASPIVYSVNAIPEQWRILYSLNPMVGVIEGFRWALIGKQNPAIEMIGVSAIILLILLCGGVVFFKRMEQTFADVI